MFRKSRKQVLIHTHWFAKFAIFQRGQSVATFNQHSLQSGLRESLLGEDMMLIAVKKSKSECSVVFSKLPKLRDPSTLRSNTFSNSKKWGHSEPSITCVILNRSRLAGQHTPFELHVTVMLPVTERLMRTPAKLTVKTICWKLFSGWKGKKQRQAEKDTFNHLGQRGP